MKLSLSLQFCFPTQGLICPSTHILLLIEIHEIYSSFISEVNKGILDIPHISLPMILFTPLILKWTHYSLPQGSVCICLLFFFFSSFILILGDFWVCTHAVEKYTSCKTNMWTSWKAETEGIIFVTSRTKYCEHNVI